MSETVESTCPYCGVGCGITATPVNEKRFAIQGNAMHPANYGRLCSKGSQLSNTLGETNRLLMPHILGVPSSWGEALENIADKFRSAIEQHGPDSVAFYLSGQILTEDYYVANKLMKGFIGSANVDTNSRLCMSSAVAAYKRAFGTDTVPTNYDDIEQTDLIVLVGSNAAWTHPILFQKMRQAQQSKPGYKMVVIDPKQTATASSADLHLAIKPGSDAMLFNGLLAYLKRSGKVDESFIEHHTNGFEDAAACTETTLTEVALYCGVPENRLRQFYDWFASAEKAVSFYSMGVNQSNSGTDKCNAIINVHLASGKIGKPGCGPFSITGQPNAMGGREVGGLANMLAAHMDFTEESIDRVSRFWKAKKMATSPGLKALDMFDAIERGDIKVLWIMGTNPAVSLPDSNRIKRILKQCDTVIVSDCIEKTDTTVLADILLPATTWGEKNGTVTNSERRISRQKTFKDAPGMARHDWWAICEVAKRLGFKQAFDYKHPAEIFNEHASLSGFENEGSRDFDISGLAHLTQQQYDDLQPIQWPVNKANPMGKARFFSDGRFYTANGKANFIAVNPTLPELPEKHELILNTGRSRDQWHTMTRTSLATKLNAHELLPRVFINPADAKQKSIADGDLVAVKNQRGEAKALAKLSDSQKPGECFLSLHWNDQFASTTKANTLTAFVSDPFSGQPQYKQSAVDVEKLQPTQWQILFSKEKQSESFPNAFAVIPIARGFLHVKASESPIEPQAMLEMFEVTDKQLTYKNNQDGSIRVTGISNEQIEYLLFMSPNSPAKSLDKLMQLFEQGHCDDDLERSLLTHASERLGKRVCACFNVSEKKITDYLEANPEADYAEVNGALRCGSNCGSCKPEVEQLIRITDANRISTLNVQGTSKEP